MSVNTRHLARILHWHASAPNLSCSLGRERARRSRAGPCRLLALGHPATNAGCNDLPTNALPAEPLAMQTINATRASQGLIPLRRAPQEQDHDTALHVAVKGGHVDAARFLIGAGVVLDGVRAVDRHC